MSKKEKNKQEVETLTEETTNINNNQEETKNDVDINKVMEDLNNQIINLENEKADLTNKVKLAQADLINYRVRKDEEVNGLLKYANKELIIELLPIVDNFERAIKSEQENVSEEVKKFYEGINLIYKGLKDTFTKYGVEEINRVGQIYDPKMEEAILTGTDESQEDEVVLEVFQKGYKLKDRVIRPASVRVNQL